MNMTPFSSEGSAAHRHPGSLWAITCHFNPLHYRTKREAFRVFRARLPVRLLAVELAFDGISELDEGDADRVVRCRDGDVLWQKERLLNVALEALPAECAEVIWLDADVLFRDPAWCCRTEDALKQHPVVQVFDRVVHARQGADPGSEAFLKGECARQGLVAGIRKGEVPLDVFDTVGRSASLGYAPGHGWAASREVLRRVGFYDALILGGGDKAFAAAAFARAKTFPESLGMNAVQASHFEAWRRIAEREIGGQVGWVEGTIMHLWHGRIEDRGYARRYRGLAPHAFDPAKDIALGRDGCWRWSSEKPALHDDVRRYFASRREDG
ncbi:MAG: hypothetical protein AAB215_08910 [Planctomycetota bacterium]